MYHEFSDGFCLGQFLFGLHVSFITPFHTNSKIELFPLIFKTLNLVK